MDCEKSVALLSESHAGTLEGTATAMVGEHLAGCLPCADVFRDIETIVLTAGIIRPESETIIYPDENLLWRRLALSKQSMH